MSCDSLSEFAQVDTPESAEERRRHFNALFSERADGETLLVERVVAHPDLEREDIARDYAQQRDKFDIPDSTGHIECKICAYGVFNKETANVAMGHFMAMYRMKNQNMHLPQLFLYLTAFWNEDVKRENPHVPLITPSVTEFHFTSCMRRFHPLGQLEKQMDGLERMKDVLEWNGVYVEMPDDTDQPTPSSDRSDATLEDINVKLTALTGYVEETQRQRRSAPNGPLRADGIAVPIFSGKSEKRVLRAIDYMRAKITSMKTARGRRRRKIALSLKEAELYGNLCGRTIQTAKMILEFNKHNHTMDWGDHGLPAYCSVNSASNTTTVVEIYSGKKKTVTNASSTQPGEGQHMDVGEVGTGGVFY